MTVPALKQSILDVIGNTPMVELHRSLESRGLKGRLLAKLEYFNPGFSKKDRIALEIIREARARGSLKEGQAVVELTSGNTGTGLAIVCRALGHPFVAVMSRGNTMERARMMQALGAEVFLVDQAPESPRGQVSGRDLALVETRTQEMVRERNAFRADQFLTQENVLAHERHTGPEIWEQSRHGVDVFLDFAGTSGTFTGVTRFLRQKKKDLRAYLVEPANAAVLSGKPVTRDSHKIQGGGYNMPDLPLLDKSLITACIQVTDEEAMEGSRILASEEGIFGGVSAGAHMAAAMQLLQTREQGSTIAFLIPDSGLKYLSTDLYP